MGHRPSPHGQGATIKLQLQKQKYTTHPHPSNIPCKYPRKYEYDFLGKDRFRKYYTRPFRLSRSRFVSNRLLKAYYGNIGARTLGRIRKASRRRRMGNTMSPYSKVASRSNTGTLHLNKNEGAKKFLLSLEQRLDTSLLRLLNLKPMCRRKAFRRKRR